MRKHRSTVSTHLPTGLVVDIYEAAVDPSRWPHVLQSLGNLFGGQQLILFSLGPAPGEDRFFWASNSIPIDSQEDYARHYWQHDPWNRTLQECPSVFSSGSVAFDRDLPDPTEFKRSVFRNELDALTEARNSDCNGHRPHGAIGHLILSECAKSAQKEWSRSTALQGRRQWINRLGLRASLLVSKCSAGIRLPRFR